MQRRFTVSIHRLVILGVFAVACGGSSTTSTKSAESAPGGLEGSGPGPSEPEALEDDAATASPTAPRCDDGSCFACGQGICPKGFYCDEQAVGGAACAWLPACPTEPTCSCIKRTLGARCSCTEREGGAFVSCK